MRYCRRYCEKDGLFKGALVRLFLWFFVDRVLNLIVTLPPASWDANKLHQYRFGKQNNFRTFPYQQIPAGFHFWIRGSSKALISDISDISFQSRPPLTLRTEKGVVNLKGWFTTPPFFKLIRALVLEQCFLDWLNYIPKKKKQQYNLKKKVLEDVLFSKGMICSSQIPCVWCSTLCTVAVFLSLAGKGRTMWHGYLHRSRLNSDDLICVSNILKKRPCFLWSRHQRTFMAIGWCLTHA